MNRTDIIRIRTIYDYFMGFRTQYNFELNPECYYPNPTCTNKILVWDLVAQTRKIENPKNPIRTPTGTWTPRPGAKAMCTQFCIWYLIMFKLVTRWRLLLWVWTASSTWISRLIPSLTRVSSIKFFLTIFSLSVFHRFYNSWIKFSDFKGFWLDITSQDAKTFIFFLIIINWKRTITCRLKMTSSKGL